MYISERCYSRGPYVRTRNVNHVRVARGVWQRRVFGIPISVCFFFLSFFSVSLDCVCSMEIRYSQNDALMTEFACMPSEYEEQSSFCYVAPHVRTQRDRQYYVTNVDRSRGRALILPSPFAFLSFCFMITYTYRMCATYSSV